MAGNSVTYGSSEFKDRVVRIPAKHTVDGKRNPRFAEYFGTGIVQVSSEVRCECGHWHSEDEICSRCFFTLKKVETGRYVIDTPNGSFLIIRNKSGKWDGFAPNTDSSDADFTAETLVHAKSRVVVRRSR